jgi:pyruvate dehydrogenase E2 component (dihydrolipoamide acetyltransferase)
MAKEKEIKVPDIGGATQVDVIEILVKVGDTFEKDTPLITLESDKASMEIPAPWAGVVTKLITKVGAKISEGDVIIVATMTSDAPQADKAQSTYSSDEAPIQEEPTKTPSTPTPTEPPKAATSMLLTKTTHNDVVFAGPAVRRMAREFGVDLQIVAGSGRKERITKEDVQAYVKARLSESPSSSGFNIPKNPAIDFSQFGSIEIKPLNKIKKLTGANVHRSWITIPHVTQNDEADITDLEAFRKSEATALQADYKLTMLAFICRVVSKALSVYPQFNASLDATGEHLIYKQYCNVGIAVETPNGLVVPVIKNVNQLSISEIAQEMARLSAKARDKGLMPADMSGGCFTISSLGGIGGTSFTPIVNSPEVAILGVSRSSIKAVYEQGQFVPKLMLPLSLSYDHRVIDGAEAARFTRYICDALSDIRRILL